MKSALLAGIAAYLFRDDPVAGIAACGNLLGSDTDTNASMAGALLGVAANIRPPQRVMDQDYIAAEADRLAQISLGTSVGAFMYPDLLKWTPPKAQLDVTGVFNGGLAVAGLGPARPLGDAVPARGRDTAVWQWLELHFGQRILVRHREQPRALRRELLPGRHLEAATLFEEQEISIDNPTQGLDLDTATRYAINSGFDPEVIGQLFLRFADTEGVDFAVAFAAIVAKARVARRGRGGGRA
jgi:hypothetical protein